MIKRIFDRLFVRIPESHDEGFRETITSENLKRLIITSIIVFLVELGVLFSILTFGTGMYNTYYYPLSVVLFNIPMIPLVFIIKRRRGRVPIKRAFIYSILSFYLAWSCLFTWATRTSGSMSIINLPLSAYLLVVFGIAIIFYLEPAWSAVLFGASIGLFIARIPFNEVKPIDISANIINALALNTLAWMTSRSIFAFRMRTYLDNRLIQDKNRELETERNNLKDALANVKQLSGLLPICAHCKKVRDDSGYWQQVEKYVTDRSEARFSHSLCPECVKLYDPGVAKKESD